MIPPTATSTRTRSRSWNDRAGTALQPVAQGRLALDAGAPARQRPGQLPPGQLKRLGGAAREEYDEARHDWHANSGILRTRSWPPRMTSWRSSWPPGGATRTGCAARR